MQSGVLDPQYPIDLLFSQLPVFLWTTDSVLHFKSAVTPHDTKVQNLLEYLNGQDNKVKAAHEKALAGQSQRFPLDAAGHHYDIHLEPIKNASGQTTGVAGVALDITEQKILENQFQSSQKMESLGRLSGGIAHDFNNILTVILNYADILQEEFKDDAKVKPKLDAIANAAKKVATLTNQLLAFSRQPNDLNQALDVNVLLGSMAHMLGRIIGEDIELVLDLKDKLGNISAEPGQILRIVMALATFARQSMPEGGKLTIKTELKENPELGAGQFVVISVADTGRGLDSEAQQHLFEPFAPNHPTNEDIGIGLAAVAGMMKQNQGQIELRSAPGSGTQFSLFFPALTAPAIAAAPVATSNTPATSAPAASSETILVVEDEDIVRQVACDIIRSSGYTVLEATNAMNALEICEKITSPINLVLTDLVMPKMNGPELIKRLAEKFPGLNVVYMSGYNSETALGKGLLKEKASFIQKPFMPKELLKVLRDTLDSQDAVIQTS
ncbi:MAG: response regulator [Myxococcota bacterium]